MATMIQSRFFVLAVLILAVGILLAGCALFLPGAGGEPIQAEVVRSEKDRVTSPDVDQAELDELVAGNSAFAFDLFQAVRESNTNLFYSPYSISVALAMVYAGARGDTEVQMGNTLHYSLAQERLHPAFNFLDLELASRSDLPEGREGEGPTLNIANSIWGQIGYSFLSDFLDVLAENYGAGLRLLNFMNAPEESRLVINNWVSDQTQGKIEDLLAPGTIGSDTRLVLTNTIYFKADWLFPFEPESTQEGSFYLLNGGQVTVPMMKRAPLLNYTEGDGYQAVELPYKGDELSMVILLPKIGSYKDFEQSLTSERVASIISDLDLEMVQLTMPKFACESSFTLEQILAELGIVDAFQSDIANFSGIDDTQSLFISDVVHKAFVSVDEFGTEAAAATVVILPMGMSTAEVTIDRPFMFMIRDIQTEAILFIGRVLDPSKN